MSCRGDAASVLWRCLLTTIVQQGFAPSYQGSCFPAPRRISGNRLREYVANRYCHLEKRWRLTADEASTRLGSYGRWRQGAWRV